MPYPRGGRVIIPRTPRLPPRPHEDIKERKTDTPLQRRRVFFTKGQLTLLRKAYDEESHPTREQQKRIAADAGLKLDQVQRWFTRNRCRYPPSFASAWKLKERRRRLARIGDTDFKIPHRTKKNKKKTTTSKKQQQNRSTTARPADEEEEEPEPEPDVLAAQSAPTPDMGELALDLDSFALPKFVAMQLVSEDSSDEVSDSAVMDGTRDSPLATTDACEDIIEEPSPEVRGWMDSVLV